MTTRMERIGRQQDRIKELEKENKELKKRVKELEETNNELIWFWCGAINERDSYVVWIKKIYDIINSFKWLYFIKKW